MQSLNSAIVEYSYENDEWDAANDGELYTRSQENIKNVVGFNFDLTAPQTDDFIDEIMEQVTEGFTRDLWV